jgi:hypothetical protein
MQEAWWVLEYQDPLSVVTMQRRCMEVSRELPTKLSICKWYKLFSEAGYVCIRKSSSKQVIDTEANEGWAVVYFAVQESWQVAQQLSVVQSTVHKFLLINVGFHSYRYQLLQHVTALYKGVCYTFFTWKQWVNLYSKNCVWWWSHFPGVWAF